ncbi:MAG: hypothetical protein ACYCZ7_01210 [Minisyncoccota bacterium]
MTYESWQDDAVKGRDVPDWELEPMEATEQKEAQESAAEEMPSVAEMRMGELAREAQVVIPENPQEKTAQTETLRAEIAGMAEPRMAASQKETSLSLKDIQEIEQSRHDSEKQFSARADIRNEKRGLFSKIFGRNKTKSIDTAQEEALRVNALVEKRQAQTQESNTEAARIILNSMEFQERGKPQIEDAEAARTLAPKVVEALKRGDFALARKEEQNLKYSGSEESQKVRRGIEALFIQNVESAIVSGDKRGMKEIVETTPYIDKTIGLGTLARMPKDVIQNETLQKKLKDLLIGLIVNARDPEASVRLASELISKGLIDAEKVHEVYRSKEIQDELSSSISGYILNARDPEKAIEKAQEFMRMGIMDKESISAVLQSSDIQDKVERDVAGWVKNARDQQRAAKELNRYLSLGIITNEKADQIKREHIK